MGQAGLMTAAIHPRLQPHFDTVIARNPGEAEFHQAVADGATDRMLWPLRHDIRHAGLEGRDARFEGREAAADLAELALDGGRRSMPGRCRKASSAPWAAN